MLTLFFCLVGAALTATGVVGSESFLVVSGATSIIGALLDNRLRHGRPIVRFVTRALGVLSTLSGWSRGSPR